MPSTPRHSRPPPPATQVYVSETTCTVDDTKDVIHFVAARAQDCPDMVAGVFAALGRLCADVAHQPGWVDPVVAASVIGAPRIAARLGSLF